jgi:outer membrane protein OmpA-like peptidoglycan-associated protein
MVTAEPNFAVNDPSPAVVLYSVNQNTVQTSNKALAVPGKLLYYTFYTHYDNVLAESALTGPSELLQARKAVELASRSGILAIAARAGAELVPDEERARQTLALAQGYLQQAEETFRDPNRRLEAAQYARTAAQIAENARALALGAVGGLRVRQLEHELNASRTASARRETELAEKIRQLEDEVAKLRSEGRQSIVRAEAAEKRISELRNQLSALEASFRQTIGNSEAQNARLREDREKICGELRRQLASLGQLTEQGGSMALTLASDILFDFGSYELRASARENLAKLAVLRLLLFPEAQVRYEGHTDRVGQDEYNQWLSEQRALAVYRFFLDENMPFRDDPAVREALQARLETAKKLLALRYPTSARTREERASLMAQLGDTVVGKGELEPVEDVPGQSERNRRVVLLFPPQQVGQITALCEASATPR